MSEAGAWCLTAAIYGLELLVLPPFVGVRELYRPSSLAALILHVGAFTTVVVLSEQLALY